MTESKADLRRRIRAYCFECDPGREDCGAPACPLYATRKGNVGAELSWWRLPRRQWSEAQHVARTEKRVIEAEEREPTEAELAARERGAARLRSLASLGSDANEARNDESASPKGEGTPAPSEALSSVDCEVQS